MTPYGDPCAKCDLDMCDPGLLSCGDSPTSPRMAAAAGDVGFDLTVRT